MKEMLLQRIQEIRAALEQSANNHNALIGRMAEAQFVFETFMKNEAEQLAKLEAEKKAQENTESTDCCTVLDNAAA